MVRRLVSPRRPQLGLENVHSIDHRKGVVPFVSVSLLQMMPHSLPCLMRTLLQLSMYLSFIND